MRLYYLKDGVYKLLGLHTAIIEKTHVGLTVLFRMLQNVIGD